MGSLKDPLMCLSSPKAPTITQTVAPPPAEAPAPLALPDGEALSVAALRLGGRTSLRTRQGPASPVGSGSGSVPQGPTGGSGSGSHYMGGGGLNIGGAGGSRSGRTTYRER